MNRRNIVIRRGRAARPIAAALLSALVAASAAAAPGMPQPGLARQDPVLKVQGAPAPPVTERTDAWVDGLAPGSRLSLRSGPGPGFSRLGYVPQGGSLVILARMGGWYYVLANGVMGFVSADYLTTSPPTGPMAPAPAPMPRPMPGPVPPTPIPLPNG